MQSLIKSLGYYLTNPINLITKYAAKGLIPMSDEAYVKAIFKQRMGYELNLANPQTFNEKLQWLKLYDHNPEYTKMVDKYAVKQYVADKIGAKLSINYGKSIEDCIQTGDKIVIKPNFVSEMNFIVSRDKKAMENPNDCFTTNIAVIKAILKVLKRINGICIKIVELPMQFCKMDEILKDDFWTEINEVFNGSIEFVDLRRTIVELSNEGMVANRETDIRSLDNYVDFDLASDSILCTKEKYVERFRVTDYPPKLE